MPHLINEKTAADTLANTGFKEAIITKVNRTEDSADIICGNVSYSGVPIFYNCDCAGAIISNGALEASSDAFASGDAVMVRFYNGAPSHIIGFTGPLWPCIAVPAFVFDSLIFSERYERFDSIDDRFYDRYTPLTLTDAEAEISTYINDANADISTGFVSFQTHWVDTEYHRDTQFLFNGDTVYSTYNHETTDNVFNGTRSNVFGAYIHPETGWGAAVYQINTFYDWKPRESGRVTFDFYLFTSIGGVSLLASAECDVNGYTSFATGEAVENVSFHYSSDPDSGGMLTGIFGIYEAGTFTSDGSTNQINIGDEQGKRIVRVTETEASAVSLPDTEELSAGYDIYIKKR